MLKHGNSASLHGTAVERLQPVPQVSIEEERYRITLLVAIVDDAVQVRFVRALCPALHHVADVDDAIKMLVSSLAN